MNSGFCRSNDDLYPPLSYCPYLLQSNCMMTVYDTSQVDPPETISI